MSNLMLWTGLAIAEVFLVLFLVLAVSWFKHRRQQTRDRTAVQKFLDKVERARGEREAEIRGFIQDNFGLSDDELEQKAVPIIRGERHLYQSFVNLYLKREADSVSGFHLTMNSAVEPYWQLEGFASDVEADMALPIEPEAVTSPVDSEELIRLRVENEQLSDELQITMNTVTRMLNEYSSMFSVGSDDVAQSSTAVTDTVGSAETEAEDARQAASETDLWDEIELEVATTGDEQIDDLDASSDPSTEEPDAARDAVDGGFPRQAADDAGQITAVNEVDGVDTDTLVAECAIENSQQHPAAGVSDAAVDELLADVLGDADLGLDDLFDEVATDQPSTEADSPGFSNHDDPDAEDKLAS